MKVEGCVKACGRGIAWGEAVGRVEGDEKFIFDDGGAAEWWRGWCAEA
jgi:hypothetical protein